MKRLIISLVLVVVLASCASPRPSYDWCFHFDFTQSNYGVNLIAGNWASGRGFLPSFSGHLELIYTHGSAVTPKAAVFYVARPADSIAAPIDFEGEATVFGMASGFLRTTIPQEVSTATILLPPGPGPGSSSSFSVSGTVSRAVELRWLDVMGDGANPFPQNNCSDFPTPTPSFGTITAPDQDVYGGLGQASVALDSVNHPLNTGLLPNESGAFVFGTIKWLVNPTTADELAGPFAPVLWHVGIFLQLDVALVGIYVIVYVAVYIVRWVIWLVRMVFQIIQTLAAVVNGVVGLIMRFFL